MAAAAGKRERRRVIFVFFKEEEQRTGFLRCVCCSFFEGSIRYGCPQKPQINVCVGRFSSPFSSISRTWILTTNHFLPRKKKRESKRSLLLSECDRTCRLVPRFWVQSIFFFDRDIPLARAVQSESKRQCLPSLMIGRPKLF